MNQDEMEGCLGLSTVVGLGCLMFLLELALPVAAIVVIIAGIKYLMG